MTPTQATRAAPATRRSWPTTALLIVAAYLLTLIDAFNGAIQLAPFFGETAQRDDYISAGMACLTALPAFAAMLWCGLQRRSQALVVIWVPIAVMMFLGLNWLSTGSGSSRDPHPSRTPDLADLFGDLTFFNWSATALFVGWAMATHLQRRRARHTEKRSAT
jgi:hypothetical protein